MLGKTHAAVGAASALMMVGGIASHHPVSLVTGAAIAAIGGLMPDIDLNSKHAKATGATSIVALATVGIANTSSSLALTQQSLAQPSLIAGLIALTVLVVLGLNSNHRGFTHSVLALALFSATVYAIIGNSFSWFTVGYASHLIIDLFNKKGESILFPLKTKVCFNLCAADGITNKVLGSLATVVSVMVLAGRLL